MSINQRRALFVAFLLIFTVFSATVILYASGYRYNTRLGRIEQVGLLSISSTQEGVAAVVNGKRYEVKRGLQLSSLLPGTYNLLLTKDGYHPWTKQLDVLPGRTTFARDIRLFADTSAEPMEIFTNPLSLLARNERYLVYRGNDTLVVYDLASDEIRELILPTDAILTQPAIDAGNHLAFQLNGEWRSMRLAAAELFLTPIIVPEETIRITPFGTVLLITTASGRVWEWDNGTLSPLFQLAETQAVYAQGDRYFVIAADPTHKRSELYQINSAHARPEFIATVPYAEAINITGINGTIVMITDASSPNLYLVDTAINPAKVVTLAGVHDYAWSSDRRSLLTASANEVSITHVRNGISQELLIRQEETILDLAWGPEESWVLYATAQGIFATERDSRDQRNNIPLVTSLPQTELLRVTKNDLLFSAQEDKTFVLYSLPFTQAD